MENQAFDSTCEAVQGKQFIPIKIRIFKILLTRVHVDGKSPENQKPNPPADGLELKRSVGLLSGIAIIIGNMIGKKE